MIKWPDVLADLNAEVRAKAERKFVRAATDFMTYGVTVRETDVSTVGISDTPFSLIFAPPFRPTVKPPPGPPPTMVHYVGGFYDIEKIMGSPHRRKALALREVRIPEPWLGKYYPTEYVDQHLKGGARIWAAIMNINSVRAGSSVTLQASSDGNWGIINGITLVTDKYKSPVFNTKRGPRLRLDHELDCYRQYLSSTPLPSMAKRARRPK